MEREGREARRVVECGKLHACLIVAVLVWTATVARGVETPTSYGEVSQLDAPVFRIPLLREKPEIDGKFSLTEWADASALTGFWSSNVDDLRPRYEHMAPRQIQSWIYAGYDKQNLYLAYVVSTYPKNAWLKARGRFPDVYNHPLYGLMGDDHIELEIRPHHDLAEAYRMGMFKWFVNPTGTIADQWWSPEAGLGRGWQSKAKARTAEEPGRWVVEMSIPLEALRAHEYAAKTKTGQPLVQIPPPDGTTYRVWFKNGIGGAGQYVVLYDQHVWNTTKTRMIFDSDAVAVQINDIGPIMEDIVDVKVRLKNHSDRSRTVRVGFFVESPAGPIYSSYDDEATNESGLVELVPGGAKELRLKKKFPGIAKDGNYLWFDVRQAGRPASSLYRCRLTKFHSVDPPPRLAAWREDKLGSLEKMRPPKKDFDFQYQYSPYMNRLSAVVDKGIRQAGDKAKTATEVKLMLMDTTEEEIVAEKTAPFHHDFATILMDLPELKAGSYKVSLLLFDQNKRIVGERNPRPFYKGAFPGTFPWEKNKIGTSDTVWAPFTPIEVSETGLEMFNHRFTVAQSGMPEQIYIRPDQRDLPLEMRGEDKKPDPRTLTSIGRGPQLRAPMRLEAVIAGRRISADMKAPAEILRKWQSEVVYRSELALGPITAELKTRYDCDGAMTCDLTYGAQTPIEVESLELVMDVAGRVDLCVAGPYGMEPTSGWDMRVPDEEGVVWDSAEDMESMELYYSSFVPWLFFGSGDRGWSWVCDSDRGWLLDRKGSTITLERDKQRQVTMRVRFINHKVRLAGTHSTTFALFTHPAKPKEKGYRRIQWMHWRPENYEGTPPHAALPNDGPGGISGGDTAYEFFLKKYPNGAPRLYVLKNMIHCGAEPLQKSAYTGEWLLNSSARVNNVPIDRKGGYGQPWVKPGSGSAHLRWGSPSWQDYFVYNFEKMVRVGRCTGWWWDELFVPVRGMCVANGMAYFRDPSEVAANELPYQSNFGTLNVRGTLKRLARVFKENNVPNYTSLWATACTTFESYASDSEMVESACGFAKTYEIDHITRFPLSGWRFAANTCKGLTTRVKPYLGLPTHPGDNPRLDRGLLGRIMSHDVGIFPKLSNPAHYLRAVSVLDDFGYFEEETTEWIPYWRTEALVRYGEEFHGDAFDLTAENPFADVHVTIYRRAYKKANGKQGYKALFVIVNEGPEPLRGRLHILKPERIFGGANTIRVADLWENLPRVKGATPPVGYPYQRMKCLEDAESGDAVTQSIRAQYETVRQEIYGPIYVRSHDYRLIYGHYDPAPEERKRSTERWQRRRNLLHVPAERPWWERRREDIRKLHED